MTNKVTNKVTNKEAINVLLHHKEAFELSGKTAEAIDLAISALEKQEQDRWIPRNERLPEYKEKVLVSYDTEDGKKVDISMFDKYGCLLGIVDAWRPLPEAYTEEES